jgi:hypothetical protein
MLGFHPGGTGSIPVRCTPSQLTWWKRWFEKPEASVRSRQRAPSAVRLVVGRSVWAGVSVSSTLTPQTNRAVRRLLVRAPGRDPGQASSILVAQTTSSRLDRTSARLLHGRLPVRSRPRTRMPRDAIGSQATCLVVERSSILLRGADPCRLLPGSAVPGMDVRGRFDSDKRLWCQRPEVRGGFIHLQRPLAAIPVHRRASPSAPPAEPSGPHLPVWGPGPKHRHRRSTNFRRAVLAGIVQGERPVFQTVQAEFDSPCPLQVTSGSRGRRRGDDPRCQRGFCEFDSRRPLSCRGAPGVARSAKPIRWRSTRLHDSMRSCRRSASRLLPGTRRFDSVRALRFLHAPRIRVCEPSRGASIAPEGVEEVFRSRMPLS